MNPFVRSSALIAAVFVVLYGFYISQGGSQVVWLGLMAITFVLLTVALWPSIAPSLPKMHRAVIRSAFLFFIGFIMVSIQLVRLQIADSAEILAYAAAGQDGTVVANPRARIQAEESIRGRILARDGQVIASTEQADDGTKLRSYPEPSAAYLAGFYSPLLYGTNNLEAAYDAYLSGENGGNPVSEWLDDVLHRPKHGYDVTLTLDLALQEKANDLLGDQRGAAVLMDAKTGEILAMASNPSFDPNQLYANSGNQSELEIEQASAYWNILTKQEGSPLLFRPTQGLYAPGSIFKTVTLAAAIDSGIAKPDTAYRDEGAFKVDDRVIVEQNRPNENRVNYTLTEAYGYSLNVVFAQVGLQLGGERLADYAKRFGLGEDIPFDLPVAPSQISATPDFLSNRSSLADTAFGQGQLLVTPLQMAELAGAIANDGEMMRPYLLDHISDASGDALQQGKPRTWKRAIKSESAAEVRDIMIESVQNGYAAGAQIPGYVVGGKTGTAEVSGQQPHAWFIGFAGEEQPQYAVAVVVEHGGEGSKVALPIGRQLLQTALQRSQS